MVGPPALRDMVALAGYPFEPGGEPPEAEVGPIRERLPVASPAEAAVLGNRELFGRLATTAMLPHMERMCREWSPDLVLRDPCEYASAVAASELGIRTSQVAISLADVEAGSIETATPALETHRRGLADELRASPYLTRFPTSLDPSPFPATVRYRAEESPRTDALPDWWDGSRAPLVYVTFGTVLAHMSIAARVFETVIEAVNGLAVRVLLTVGRAFEPTILGPLPAHVHVEAWVDQADVLPSADLVVCHGGSGTVFGALASGVPLVVAPVFADQFVNGERVAASGAGVVVGDERSAARIASAIGMVLGTGAYRQKARRIGAEMAATASVAEVLDDLATEPGRAPR